MSRGSKIALAVVAVLTLLWMVLAVALQQNWGSRGDRDNALISHLQPGVCDGSADYTHRRPALRVPEGLGQLPAPQGQQLQAPRIPAECFARRCDFDRVVNAARPGGPCIRIGQNSLSVQGVELLLLRRPAQQRNQAGLEPQPHSRKTVPLLPRAMINHFPSPRESRLPAGNSQRYASSWTSSRIWSVKSSNWSSRPGRHRRRFTVHVADGNAGYWPAGVCEANAGYSSSWVTRRQRLPARPNGDVAPATASAMKGPVAEPRQERASPPSASTAYAATTDNSTPRTNNQGRALRPSSTRRTLRGEVASQRHLPFRAPPAPTQDGSDDGDEHGQTQPARSPTTKPAPASPRTQPTKAPISPASRITAPPIRFALAGSAFLSASSMRAFLDK